MTHEFDPRKTCLHLRTKAMSYAVPSKEAEEHAKEVERLYGACDTAVYWCDCTQGGRGPDDRPANLEACSRPGRRCFVSVSSLT